MTATEPRLQHDVGPKPLDVPKPDTDDLTLWSVTTIIGVLDKPALLYWAAEQSALAAVASANSLPSRIQEDGEAETVKWLRDARFRRPKNQLSAASLGTVVHTACEEYVLTGTRPDTAHLAALVSAEAGKGMTFDAVNPEADVVSRTVDQFDRFLQAYQPDYMATEVTVFSPTYAYAGTADGFMRLDGVPLIFDYKTSRDSFDKRGNPKTPYPEVGLQLAAYRYSEMAAVWRPRRYEKFRRRYYLLSQQEQDQAVKPPDVDGGVVIHLSPERYGVWPVRCDEQIHEQFLFVQEAARFVLQTAKSVVGSELVPPNGEAA